MSWCIDDSNVTTRRQLLKEQRRINYSTDYIRRNRITTKLGNRNEKKTQLSGYLKRQTGEMSHEKTWTWLENRNFKRKTESLLIAKGPIIFKRKKIIHNKIASISYVVGDWDEMINHLISECSQPEQREYETLVTTEWGEGEMWSIWKFDYMTKWFMHSDGHQDIYIYI